MTRVHGGEKETFVDILETRKATWYSEKRQTSTCPVTPIVARKHCFRERYAYFWTEIRIAALAHRVLFSCWPHSVCVSIHESFRVLNACSNTTHRVLFRWQNEARAGRKHKSYPARTERAHRSSKSLLIDYVSGLLSGKSYRVVCCFFVR